MPGPLSLTFALSPAAVAQTLARVENAAHYAQGFESRDLTQVQAYQWRTLLDAAEPGRLAEFIRRSNVTPYDLLEDEQRAMLRHFALESPELRAELQEGAARIERSIGLILPLRLSLRAGVDAGEDLPRGMALLLNRPVDRPDSGATQVFQLDDGETAASTRDPRVRTELLSASHSPKIRGHFAEAAIKEIAKRPLAGRRIIPLSSPIQTLLDSRQLTRVGRFTFLGIDLSPARFDGDGDWERLLPFEDQADVLVLGGLTAVEPSLVLSLIASLRPRLTLAGSEAPSFIRSKEFGAAALIAPGADAHLRLDPVAQNLTVTQGAEVLSVSWERSSRYLQALERARAPVTRTVFGNILRDRRDWRWSQSVLNGAIPQALRYLILLDASPDLTGSVASREEFLRDIVNQMTKDLDLPGADTDHVAAFKEVLLQSGLLDPNGGT